MKKLTILLVGLGILLFLSGSIQDRTTTEIRIGNETLKVRVADSQEERVRGLSGQKTLENGEGMLFIFDEPTLPGIWMKDMRFAIDIIWIDEDMRVLGIEKSVSPETFPEILYPPSEVKFVLEVKSGFSDEIGLREGEILSIGQKIP